MNPVNSGDGVVFRRIDVRNTLCVLVWAFILPGGQVQPPITAFVLPADAATCLTATTANHVAATNVTGTVGSSDGGRHFGIDLHLTFPGGMDWLAPVIDFQVDNLPLDGVWYPAP